LTGGWPPGTNRDETRTFPVQAAIAVEDKGDITMKIQTIAAAGLALMLASGSALAWDLHDTLAPGPTPPTSDAPPAGQDFGSGADLQIPDVDIDIPAFSPSIGAPLSDSRCADAIARHGENSAEAWTQC
jgi:hypothetical protein